MSADCPRCGGRLGPSPALTAMAAAVSAGVGYYRASWSPEPCHFS